MAANRNNALHPIEASHLHARRERVFLVFAGLFLGSMTMLNILGVSRFIDMSFTIGGWDIWDWIPFLPDVFPTWKIPFMVAIGVLPYPITFLCTDFISELYGRRRANFVVWVGVLLNGWVLLFMWLGGALPPVPPMTESGLPATEDYSYAFYVMRSLSMGAVVASMLAYMAAQFIDVFLFHFWKNLTRGRHLWLRNNGSTLVSQFVDAFTVITITHFFASKDGLPMVEGRAVWTQLWIYIGSNYVFKLAVALVDTIPFYIGVHVLSRYLQIDPRLEHDADIEGAYTGHMKREDSP
ncbi:MAG: queuosine precursor transporter [Planctomycetota bacterium]